MALMNLQRHRELCEVGRSEFGHTGLVTRIFDKYFCYFDANRIADSLQLQFNFEANHVSVQQQS